MQKPYPFYPFLFALFPVLSLYSKNIDEVHASSLFLPIIILQMITALGFILMKFILKGYHKSAIIVFFLLLFIFSPYHIFNILMEFSFLPNDFRWFRFALLIFIVLFPSLLFIIKRTRKDLINITKIFNLICGCLIVIQLGSIATYAVKTLFEAQENSSLMNGLSKYKNTRPKEPLRDIYYIIMDRYVSARSLREYFNFDNSEFMNYLSGKGFYIASDCLANYPVTHLSLASALHMKYINYLRDEMGEGSTDKARVYKMIQDYPVWRFLKSKGYQFVHVGSSWIPTHTNKFADKTFNYGLSPFYEKLFASTILGRFASKLKIPPFEGWHLNRWKEINYQFKKLRQIPGMKSPKYVFAHLLTPHPPYVFDSNGNFMHEEKQQNRSRRSKYIDQLLHANKKLKELIDTILSSSGADPIIVIQSDEGPYSYETDGKQIDNFRKMNLEELKLKARILNVYHLPGADRNILFPSISPVNTFRFIFNLYFNTSLELLPDDTYGIRDYHHPYTFFDISERFRSGQKITQ